MAARSLPAEQSAIKTYSENYGKLPENSEEWDVVHRLAYPTYSALPDEFKSAQAEAAYAVPVGQFTQTKLTGVNPQALTASQQRQQSVTDYQKTANTAQTSANQSAGELAGFQKGAGSFFSTLQGAIREKMGATQAGIGQSELYKQAGLTDHSTLQQSLAMKGTELDSSRADLQNVINGLGTSFQAQANAVKTSYDNSIEQYKFASTQADKALKDIADHADAIEVMKLQHELDMVKERYQQSQLNARAAASKADSPDSVLGVPTITGQNANVVFPTFAEYKAKNPAATEAQYKEVYNKMLKDRNTTEKNSLKQAWLAAPDVSPLVKSILRGDMEETNLSQTERNKVGQQLEAAKQAGVIESKGTQDPANTDPVRQQLMATKGLTKVQGEALAELYDTQGADGAKKWAYNNVLSNTEKDTYNSYANAIQAGGSAIPMTQGVGLEAGPWKALKEAVNPWRKITRDKKYETMYQLIEQGQAQVRKGFFGTAVSGSEAASALKFLIGEEDGIASIETKLRGQRAFLTFVNDATLARSVGIEPKPLADYLKAEGIDTTVAQSASAQTKDGTHYVITRTQ